MSRLLPLFALFCALAAALPARADELAALRSPSGVTLQASLEQGSRLVIAVLPDSDIRLNGRLGVSFEAQGQAPVWGDSLPRLVLGPGDYFLEPVLETIHLDPATLADPAAATVVFGACLPVSGICVLEEALLTLSRDDDGALNLDLAMLEP